MACEKTEHSAAFVVISAETIQWLLGISAREWMGMSMRKALRRWLPWRFIAYLVHRFLETDCSYRAASLVYTTLLSLVPLMIVILTVLSVIPHFRSVGTEMEQFIFNNFVTQAAGAIVLHIRGFIENASQLSWVNLFFLFVVCTLLIHNIRCAFNRIWGVEERRHYFSLFAVYGLVLLMGPSLVAGMMVASAYLAALPYIDQVTSGVLYKSHLLRMLPYGVTFLIFTGLNKALPACAVPWRAALVGGLITAILFELAKWGFTVYLAHVPTYQLLYGALAAIPIFLLWLYLSWILVLVGAMIAQIMTRGLPP